METKKSKVLVAAFSREFNTQNGVFYCHQITFENQDTGEYVSKSKDQTKFIVGQEAEYTSEPNGNFPNKIKPAQQPFAGGGGGGFRKENPESRRSIERQTCLKAAVEVSPEGAQPHVVLSYAEQFVQWLGEGGPVKKEDLTPPTPTVDVPAIQPDENGNLPF